MYVYVSVCIYIGMYIHMYVHVSNGLRPAVSEVYYWGNLPQTDTFQKYGAWNLNKSLTRNCWHCWENHYIDETHGCCNPGCVDACVDFEQS